MPVSIEASIKSAANEMARVLCQDEELSWRKIPKEAKERLKREVKGALAILELELSEDDLEDAGFGFDPEEDGMLLGKGLAEIRTGWIGGFDHTLPDAVTAKLNEYAKTIGRGDDLVEQINGGGQD